MRRVYYKVGLKDQLELQKDHLISIYRIKMKLNQFKIRKVQGSDSNVHERSGQPEDTAFETPVQKSLRVCQENMLSLMTMFQGFMKTSLQNTKNNSKSLIESHNHKQSQLQYQTRDRHLIFQLPETAQQPIKSQTIERWVTEVTVGAFSSSFNYYLTEQMTFEQAKIFCSETILANLMRFTQKYRLNEQHLEMINSHLSSQVLEYLQKKYPLTLSTDVNKALQKQLQQTNNFELHSNDFLYSNGIIFKHRSDGNYNDIIMKVINKTLQIVDGDSGYYVKSDAEDEIPTSYQDFEQYMSSLFNKIYDEDWMSGRKMTQKSPIKEQSKINRAEIKQKYYQKVKQYSSYLIGRKLSENTPHFTQQQINSKNLEIRNPATLRILTKWCEQLWQKFEKQSYYSERAQPLVLQDPQFVNPFFKWMRIGVDNKMGKEKLLIQQFKKKLDSHYNLQESKILLKYLEEDSITFIPKLEKAYGMFATHMVRNLHSYIILYLNRLIHGILTVAKQFFEAQIKDNKWNDWHLPPNLVTFKIGDLMRCKCSSKQRQIIKVYKQIMKRSNENPQRIKIVRIKNRLRQGTNDILMNVKFNNTIICEIQLQVNNKSKSKFIQCSNAFSHYIYELKRSIFGPITQLCNIWNNYEARAATFDKLVNKPHISVNSIQKIAIPQCKTQGKHKFEPYHLPFQCSVCKKLYFHNNYIFLNKSCQLCGIFFCARCQIKELTNEELKIKIFKKKTAQSFKNHAVKLQNDFKIPTEGLCVNIQSSEIKVQLFDFNTVQSKNWLFGINQKNEVYQIFNIRTPSKIKQFFRRYLVFQFQLGYSVASEQILEEQQKIFALGLYMSDCFKQEKQLLIFTQIMLNYDHIKRLFQQYCGTEKQRKKITRVEMAGNDLPNAAFLAPFDNIRMLNLDFNNNTDLGYLSVLPKLQHLELNSNKLLNHLSDGISTLESLQFLKLSECDIASLPSNFGNLKNLKTLKLQQNSLNAFPQSFWDLTSLQALNLSANQIQVLPDKFHKMQNLRKLKISRNKLSALPQSITLLSNLTHLSVQFNRVGQIPEGLQNLQKLQKLQLNGNKILQKIPQKSFLIPTLKYIYLNNNKLQSFMFDLSKCKELQELELHQNEIAEFTPTIGNCLNLSVLTLQMNSLKELPKQLANCTKLSKKLNFRKNQLKQIPAFVFQINESYWLDLAENVIEELPALDKLIFAQSLNLVSNKIKEIPEGVMSIKQISQFDFRDNQIERIPLNICQFDATKQKPNSVWQKLSGNNIRYISEPIQCQIKSAFKLTFNSLTQLPVKNIIEKQKLRILSCHHNQIEVIPREIKAFSNLARLNLSFNLIQLIPAELAELSSIQEFCLSLNKNPWKVVECKEFVQQKGSTQTKWDLNFFGANGFMEKFQPETKLNLATDDTENSILSDFCAENK